MSLVLDDEQVLEELGKSKVLTLQFLAPNVARDVLVVASLERAHGGLHSDGPSSMDVISSRDDTGRIW